MFNRIRQWAASHPHLTLTFLVCAALGPFVDKAVHWDDCLFVWTARQIGKHPLDFFGFDVNWVVAARPMWMENCNPPLFSYFLAIPGMLFGWSEIPLHLACLAVACMTAIGIYSLARIWCGRPLLATLIAIVTPAFLVSSSTLMCDVPMLCLWIWAMVLWERALAKPENLRLFLGASFLAGLALLAKFSIIVLTPLLFMMAALRLRKPGWWLLCLAIPLLMLGGYELITIKLYGQGHFQWSIDFPRTHPHNFPGGWTAQTIVGLTFIGGCLLPLLFYAPFLWRWKTLLAGGILILGACLLVIEPNRNLGLMIRASNELMNHWYFLAQLIVLVAAGLHVLCLVAGEIWSRRDTTTIVLTLWILLGIIFSCALNWTINGRSILIFVPAIAILTVRRLDSHPLAARAGGHLLWPLVPAAGIALSLVIADFNLANAGRKAATEICAKYKSGGSRLWFEGHDSFQYYMENLGALPVDAGKTSLKPGDVVVVSELGIRFALPALCVGWVDEASYSPLSWVNLAGQTENGAAGFYAAFMGPVPFEFSRTQDQNYFILKAYGPAEYHADTTPIGELSPNSQLDFPPDKVAPDLVPDQKTSAVLQAAEKLEADGKFKEAFDVYRTALQANPREPHLLSSLARLLATSADPKYRNGATAVQLASQAAYATSFRDPLIIETLAAAYAQDQQVAKAVNVAEIAAVLADLTGRPDVAYRNRGLAARYAAGQTAN